MSKMVCANCHRTPDELQEYVDAALDEDMTPIQYVVENEGTFSPKFNTFYCTNCYILVGMPRGQAPRIHPRIMPKNED